MTLRHLGPHFKINHPLNVCNIKNDPNSSSIINIENNYIMELLSKIRNGDITYDGWYRFQYNQTFHSLDLVLFEAVDEVSSTETVILRITDEEIVI